MSEDHLQNGSVYLNTVYQHVINIRTIQDILVVAQQHHLMAKEVKFKS